MARVQRSATKVRASSTSHDQLFDIRLYLLIHRSVLKGLKRFAAQTLIPLVIRRPRSGRLGIRRHGAVNHAEWPLPSTRRGLRLTARIVGRLPSLFLDLEFAPLFPLLLQPDVPLSPVISFFHSPTLLPPLMAFGLLGIPQDPLP